MYVCMYVCVCAGVEAEAELLSAIVASLQDMGLTAKDVGIKINSRKILNGLMTKVGESPVSDDLTSEAAMT